MSTEETNLLNEKFVAAIQAGKYPGYYRTRAVPSRHCWRMSRKQRLAVGRILYTPSGRIRGVMRFGQSKMLLIMPPQEIGGDPDAEWKKWADRISATVGRIPGNWKTSRGRKKRIKWLMRNFAHY